MKLAAQWIWWVRWDMQAPALWGNTNRGAAAGAAEPLSVVEQKHNDPAALWWYLGNTQHCEFLKFHFNKHIKLVFLKISCLRTASPLPVKISSKNMNVGVRSLSSCSRICQNILLDACETCPKTHFQSSNYYHPNSFLQHLIWDKPLSKPFYMWGYHLEVSILSHL